MCTPKHCCRESDTDAYCLEGILTEYKTLKNIAYFLIQQFHFEVSIQNTICHSLKYEQNVNTKLFIGAMKTTPGIRLSMITHIYTYIHIYTHIYKF